MTPAERARLATEEIAEARRSDAVIHFCDASGCGKVAELAVRDPSATYTYTCTKHVGLVVTALLDAQGEGVQIRIFTQVGEPETGPS